MIQTKPHDMTTGACPDCASPQTCTNFARCVLEPLAAEEPEALPDPQAIAAE